MAISEQEQRANFARLEPEVQKNAIRQRLQVAAEAAGAKDPALVANLALNKHGGQTFYPSPEAIGECLNAARWNHADLFTTVPVAVLKKADNREVTRQTLILAGCKADEVEGLVDKISFADRAQSIDALKKAFPHCFGVETRLLTTKEKAAMSPAEWAQMRATNPERLGIRR
jgi:hypothetical protein